MAQLIKRSDLHSKNCGFEPHCRRGVFGYGSLASLSLQIVSVASELHGKINARSAPVDNEGQDHTTIVKDPPLPSHKEYSQILGG